MAAEREAPPREVLELALGAPALPDLDINQTALADTLARHPLVMQRLTPIQAFKLGTSCPSWPTTVPTP